MIKTRNPRWICTFIGLALLAMSAGCELLGPPIAQWLSRFPLIATAAWGPDLINTVLLYLIGLPLLLPVLLFIPNGPVPPGQQGRPAPFGPGKFLLTLVAALGLLYAGSFVTSAIYEGIRVLTGVSGQQPMGDMPSLSLFASLLFYCAVPAVGEEFIFRYMLRKKMRGAGDRNFILLSALCFSLFHMNFEQLLYTFLAGLVFAWIYVRTEKFWMSILLHFAVNATGSVLLPALEARLPEWFFPIFMLACIAGAVIILVVFRRKIFGVLAAPTEPRWPRKRASPGVPPRPVPLCAENSTAAQTQKGVLILNAGILLYIAYSVFDPGHPVYQCFPLVLF